MTSSDSQTQQLSDDVLAERRRQNAAWGERNHPDGTGPTDDARRFALETKVRTDVAAELGRVTWRDLLLKEVAEAFAENDPAKLRTELVQVIAVASQWVEAIDRREQS